MNANVIELESVARKLFGSDIEILLARHPSYGDDEVEMLVYGVLHPLAAAVIARSNPRAKVEKLHGSKFSTGKAYTYTSVTLPPN